MDWILPGLLKSLSSSSLSTSSSSIVVWLGLSLAIINVPIRSASADVPEPSTSSSHFIDSNPAPESAIASLAAKKSESSIAASQLFAASSQAVASTVPDAQPLYVSLQPDSSESAPATPTAVESSVPEMPASEVSALQTSAPLLSASLSVPGAELPSHQAIAAVDSPAVLTHDSASQLPSSVALVSPSAPAAISADNATLRANGNSEYSSVAAPLTNTPLTGLSQETANGTVAAVPAPVAPGYNPLALFTFNAQTPPAYVTAQALPYTQPTPLVSVAIPGQTTAQSSMPSGAVPVFNTATGTYIMMMPVPVSISASGSNPSSTFNFQAPVQPSSPMGGTSSPMTLNSGYNPYALPGFNPSGNPASNPALMQNPYVSAPYGQTAYGQVPIAYGQPVYGQSQTPYAPAPYGQASYTQAPYGQPPVTYGQSPFGQGYGQVSYGQAPTAYTQTPYGQAPYGQVSYGQAPTAYTQTPYGQAPYGQVSYGQAPTAYTQTPYGQAPYGQVFYGQAPTAYPQTPYGQAPYGQVFYGQAPYGQAPYGQAPTGYQGTPPLTVPSVPTGNRVTPLPPPPAQGQSFPVFPVGYPATSPTGVQATPVLAPTQFQQSQQPTYLTPGTANQLTPTSPTYSYPGSPVASPSPLLGAPGQESLARRAPITSPSIQLQGGLIYQGDDFSGRARVSAIYPFSPNVLLGGILDFASGPAITSTDEEGVSINELYLAASLDDLPNLRLLIGQLDLTSYFDRNSFAKDSLTHFLNPVFQTNPALAAAAIGSRPGVLLNWSLSDNLEVKAAAFSSDRSITDFALNAFAGEVGFRTGNFILRGTYTTSIDGGQRSSFQEAFSVARREGGFGVDEDDQEDSYGVNAELFIPALNMGIFGRYGQYNNRDLDLKGDTYSLGVNFLDLFTPGDRLGVGYGRDLSNDRLRVQAGTELPDVLEVFYDLQLHRNLRMGFSFQQLNEFSESVAGIRIRADFDVSPRGSL